ncbi:MAG: galactokinase [Bacteroidia bacterium]|nr:galactokinase [Bacteroidia bacterium]
MHQAVLETFHHSFHQNPTLVIAPGRINLIGEHTDYNEGFVLPAAIDKGIVFAVAANHTSTCRIIALDLDDQFEVDLDEIRPLDSPSWPNYLLGVIHQFQIHGYPISGFDCVFGGNIPVGAGLSSSAAVECGIGYALSVIFDLKISRMDLVRMAQKAEHTFPGVQCGIMDQFASTFGEENHVVRLDCRSLEYEYFPFDMSEYKILLCDTRVSHSLANSEYNTRRQECESGVKILQKFYPNVKTLRDTTHEMLLTLQKNADPVIFKRCSYVVEENLRVIQTCEALSQGQVELVGEYLYQSHEGLQHLYEVSCPELDFLVEETLENPDVLGARMMGGGFGGCTLNLVKADCTESVAKKLSDRYESQFGRKPGIYITSITSGVREILLPVG